MKRSRFSEEQIIGIVKEHQAGLSAAEPSEQHTGPWRHQGHIQRPDTRPIEDPADPRRSRLPNRGNPHTPRPRPTAQTWKLPFAKSIASMLIFVFIGAPSAWFYRIVMAYVTPSGSIPTGGGHERPARSARLRYSPTCHIPHDCAAVS
jgi:hypothetical protein